MNQAAANRGPWDSGEVYEAYIAAIASQFDALKGRGTYAQMGQQVYDALKAKFTIEVIANSALLPLIIDGVHKESDLRCIEKNGVDQGELFGTEFLNAVIKIDPASIMKVRSATAAVLRQADKRKYTNVRTVQNGYARWRDRLELLLTDGGMEADPKLTVEDAIKNIKPKRGR